MGKKKNKEKKAKEPQGPQSLEEALEQDFTNIGRPIPAWMQFIGQGNGAPPKDHTEDIKGLNDGIKGLGDANKVLTDTNATLVKEAGEAAAKVARLQNEVKAVIALAPEVTVKGVKEKVAEYEK